MKTIFLIGHNQMRLFVRQKMTFIWIFAIPLVFIYMMGFVNQGPGDPRNPQGAVSVENLDTNFLSKIFLEELGAQGVRVVDPSHQKEARGRIRIPPDFTSKVLGQEPVSVSFERAGGQGDPAAALVQLRYLRALIAINAAILKNALQNGGDAVLTESALKAAHSAPPQVVLEAHFAGRKPVPTGFNFSLPGNLVMYLMMNVLIFGGSIIASNRREGILRRLASLPVRRLELVLGAIYGLMIFGALQIGLLLVAGRFLFQVNLGANLGAVLITLIVYAWVAASLGVLIGSLVTDPEKIIGLCVLASLTMAALGGCWWPLEMAPPLMRALAHCFPTGWAMDALHRVISFGGNLSDTWKEIGVLFLFGLAANALAIQFFRPVQRS